MSEYVDSWVFAISYMLMFRKTAIFIHFGQIRPFPVAESGQNCQKAHLQDLSYKPILRYLWPSVTKIQPGKELMTDRRTYGQTDGHPESIGLQPLGLGPYKNLGILINMVIGPSGMGITFPFPSGQLPCWLGSFGYYTYYNKIHCEL